MIKNLISVIIPCYNMEKYLPTCFECLKKVTYKNIEYIFINDGSTDNTLSLLENFCKDNNNCKIVNQINQGVSAARNAGLKSSNGEFITFYDPDDYISPDLYTILHNNITKMNADIAISRYVKVNEKFNIKKVKNAKFDKQIKLFNQEDAISQLFSGKLFDVSLWNKLYRHEILTQIDGFPNLFNKNITYGEDSAFNMIYFNKISNAVLNYNKLYYYVQRSGSLVHSKFNEKRLSTFIGIDNSINLCKNKFSTAEKYVRSWKGLVSVEMLFYIFKCDYSNSEKIKELLNNLKENMKFIVYCKRNFLYRRILVPLTYPLFKLFLKRRIKT